MDRRAEADWIELSGGRRIATYAWGSRGPLVLMHHATGLCAAVWRRIAEALAPAHRVVAFDVAGHGRSDPPTVLDGWVAFGRDLTEIAAVICRKEGRAAVDLGVGHSLGGVAMLLATREEPERFARLALLDPVVISAARAAREGRGRGKRTSLSLSTRMRRRTFGSREEARAELAATDLLAAVHPAVLDDYIRGGLADTPDGVALRCDPSLEAAIYELGATPEIFGPPRVERPTLLVRGARSHFDRSSYEELLREMPHARMVEVEAGHLVPLEVPDEVVTLLQDVLKW